jgi:hypothetical protein
VSASAQMQPVGVVDFYGLHQVSAQQARDALGIVPGDTLSALLLATATVRVGALPGVAQARLEPVCCEYGKTILYVGVEEEGAPTLHFRPAPTGTVHLPDDVLQAGEAFQAAFDSAIAHQDFAEDDSAGHQLMHFPAARAVEERFISLAARRAGRLRDVLRHSSDADQRALAVQVLAYVADKRTVTGDLVYGMRDPDAVVRNNAMRALGLIASLAQRRPELHIAVPFAPFVDLLNSPVWTDRNKASLALYALSASRDSTLFALLRAQALPALAEMARWKVPGHAGAACVILGRLGGMSEQEIKDAWTRADRERFIRAAGVSGGG